MSVRKRKKRKVNVFRVVIAIVILLVVMVALFFVIGKGSKIISKDIMYLASSDNMIRLYIQDEDGKLKEDKDLVRGTKVDSYKDTINDNNKEYVKIEYDKNIYYVSTDNLVKNENDVVQEKVKYVRTSVTVYQNNEDSKIESFIKKGNKLDIVGYDKLLEDGTVNMYKINSDGNEGWVYGKYLVDDEESANEPYNENSVYDIHNISHCIQ